MERADGTVQRRSTSAATRLSPGLGGRLRHLILATALLSATVGCSAEGLLLGAGATVGVAASQERGLGAAIDDTAIRAEINHNWLQSDFDLYRRVSLQVQEGRVLLTGQVPTPGMRLEAVRLAWQAEGVKEVINEIEVEESSTVGFTRDTWISTQLKSKLLFDRDVSSINYSIETVDGVIYLMGVAQDRAELDRVVAHARNLAYVQEVISYVRVKEPASSDAPED
jgi:osmotically-inducible protein OsmY